MRPFRRLVAGGVAAAAATATLLTAQVVPATAAGQVGWGMQAGPEHKIPNRDNRWYIAAAEAQVGRAFVYDPRYYNFGVDPVISAREQWAKSVGKTPFIHLSGNQPWSQVAGGAYDGYLKNQAALLKAFGAHVIFNYANEVNLKSQNHGTPQQYRAAYNHIVSVFRAAGVTNVSYALTLTNGAFSKGDSWYPGDGTIDVIAPTGYNWACVPGKANFGKPACGQAWKSFQTVFAAAYSFTVKHHKTMIVAETGTAEDPFHAGRKAQWILDMARTAKNWPALRGIIWFEAGKRLNYWRVDSSQSALTAYKCVGHDPAFGGTGPTCAGT